MNAREMLTQRQLNKKGPHMRAALKYRKSTPISKLGMGSHRMVKEGNRLAARPKSAEHYPVYADKPDVAGP